MRDNICVFFMQWLCIMLLPQSNLFRIEKKEELWRYYSHNLCSDSYSEKKCGVCVGIRLMIDMCLQWINK